MKCTKVLCATAVAATMIATMGSSVWASEASTNKTSDKTTVTYNVDKSYAWTVPSQIIFTAGEDEDKATQTGEVKVTKNVIGQGETLKITAAGNGGGNDTNGSGNSFVIKNEENTSLDYTVKSSDNSGETSIISGGKVLSVVAGTKEKTATLTFELTRHAGENNAEISGNYTGLVIYTATIESAK